MPHLKSLPHALEQLRQESLLREERAPESEHLRLDACSNDYLGLSRELVSRETFEQACRLGAGASRLVHGTSAAHLQLEAELSRWLEEPAALLFSSGYAANLGVVAALCDASSVIVSDELNHASLIDGCRLSRARVEITPHNDLTAVASALERHRGAEARYVLVESYYSMEGDGPDLGHLRSICDLGDAALVVDEAHALGVYGPAGRGRCAEAGVRPDVLVGTFGKAFGAQGAFVASTSEVREWLWNKARSFVFSTAPSPLLTEQIRRNLAVVMAADQSRRDLHRLAEHARRRLRAGGLQLVKGSHGPILAILLGDNRRALVAAAALREAGIRVQAIRPPSVPEGLARLRVTLRANMSKQDLERLCHSLIQFCT